VIKLFRFGCVLLLCLWCASGLRAQAPAPRFHVIALAEKGGIHKPFVDAAKLWLAQEAARDHFAIDYVEDTKPIDDAFLSHYQLFIQLNYPPYNWTPPAAAAFVRYIDEGRGGWIGFHHATLLGHFDGFDVWPWFSDFMGGIQFKSYIATFATGTVHVEDLHHPAMTGLPASFQIENEEWYTWDKDPRSNVHVLATVDEHSYTPSTNIKMGGDHPVVWTNDHKKARNIYIFMGHHPELFENQSFTTLFHNSILWAAHQ
jgi:uncharacterized protein